jgi:glycerol-3-phosphate dehydrogenase (NAD(P)+)
MSRIAVIGAGAWGTALSIVLARNGAHKVRLWAYEAEVRESIDKRRQNELFLPGCEIPAAVSATNNWEDLRDAEIVVSVMPSHHCRRLFTQAAPFLKPETLIVSATKGVENDTLLRMSEVIVEVVSQKRGFQPRVGALSGPSFAKEVARGDPTAVAIASTDSDLALRVQREFSDPAFRIYTNDDMAGVELGGALKNVIAIAAGVCDGLGLGYNTVAALITRGLAEITRLVTACGGRPVGVELGKGRRLDDIIAGMHGMVAEGVLTTNAARALAEKQHIEMPITGQMFQILHDGKSARDAIRELMTRRATEEGR